MASQWRARRIINRRCVRQVRKVPTHLRQDIYEFYRTMCSQLRNISPAAEILNWLRFTYGFENWCP
eukprot:COSAG01_NODE_1441_length_10293_cov_4.232392_8_plen_66_part_00